MWGVFTCKSISLSNSQDDMLIEILPFLKLSCTELVARACEWSGKWSGVGRKSGEMEQVVTEYGGVGAEDRGADAEQ